MTETFTASNGIELRATENGWLERRNGGERGTGTWDEVGGINTKSPALVWDALREFFQHERDQELGRWRWPDNPDFVVYPDGTSRRVVKESTGQTMSVSLHDRKVMETYLDSYVGAARAYDAAHPQSKPWHEAVEGEVWLLMFPNSTQAWFVNGGYFQNVRTLTNINKTDPGITAGRRIWPEVSDA